MSIVNSELIREVITRNDNSNVLATMDRIESEGWKFVKEEKVHGQDDVTQPNGFVFTSYVKLHFTKEER